MADFPDDFFRQEDSEQSGGGGTGSGGDAIPGTWGYGGGGAGGGPGGDPGDETDYISGYWTHDDEEEPEEDKNIPGEWKSVKVNFPFLKVSEKKSLLLHDNFLLLGQLLCPNDPQLVIFLSPDVWMRHLDCVLLRLSNSRSFSKSLDEDKRKINYWIDWGVPGKFDVSLRWQSGHYKYSEISQMRVFLFGIELGWIKIPISNYLTVARIEIKKDYTVYVNYRKGSLRTVV